MSLNDLTAEQVRLMLEKMDFHFSTEAHVARALGAELGTESRAYKEAQDKCQELFVVRSALDRRWRELVQLEEVRRRSGVAA